MTVHDSHAVKGATPNRQHLLARGNASAPEAVALLCGLALLPVIAALLAALTGPATVRPAPGKQAPAQMTTALLGQTPDHGTVIGYTTALPTTTDRQWTPITNATITLNKPGVYEVTQQVRGQFMTAPNKLTHAWINSRLFNTTTGAPLGESNLLIITSTNHPPSTNREYGTTATGRTFIETDQPTTIRLEAKQTQDTGTVTKSQIITDPNGFTKLLYKRLA